MTAPPAGPSGHSDQGPVPVVIRVDGQVVIDTGSADDVVRISTSPNGREQHVTVNDHAYVFPADVRVVVRTGEGDDSVSVLTGTGTGVTVLAGPGDDQVLTWAGPDIVVGDAGKDVISTGPGDDRVDGGAQNDYIDGGAGDDILAGGHGGDVIYGLSGDDRIAGGPGCDYLEGGTGQDRIDGGADNDIVSGGRGADVLRGDDGADVIYSGPEVDRVDGGTHVSTRAYAPDGDVSYAQPDDAVSGVEHVEIVHVCEGGPPFRISGSTDFVERVQADLDLLRVSPRGRMLLDALGHGPGLVIQQTWQANGFFEPTRPEATIQYNPSFSWADAPPIAVLYHELCHGYQFVISGWRDVRPHRGTDDLNVDHRERAAVGLPVDHDGRPETPMVLAQPLPFTESGLRDEMSLPARTRYTEPWVTPENETR